MGQAKGSKSKIIYESEATFKTTNPAALAHVLPFTSESLGMSRNLLDSATLRGSRSSIQPVRGNQEIAGDITVELDPYMGKLLYHTLGTFSTSGANPYSHTFKISDLPTGLTIEKQFTDLATPEYFTFNGCKVNSMKLTVKPEGFVETTFNFMGATHTVTAASFDTDATDYTSSAVGGVFDGFEAAIVEGGSSLGIATNFDITLENNVDGSIYVIGGQGTRYALPEGIVKVSGTVTALFEDMTMYNKALNNTETSLRITLTHGTGAGSAYNEKLEMYFDELLFSPQSPKITGPNGVMVELPFTAYYKDGANSSALAMILWNTQTAGNVQS